ncbi:YgaP family membrane protein [Spirosoma spitsbergense]|uniref:YgaP family membrane protein n=1 Tax=Spirosoma spitsbergense TaxID=431554 RepID=UPI000371ED5B|nr:DUF2892 domain-containing protein [Spirosoma spitsbergense]
MDDFFRFIASPAGRGVRIAVGFTLVATGLAKSDKLNWGTLGMVPLAAGLFDWCVLGPFTGKPFEGEELRRTLDRPNS